MTIREGFPGSPNEEETKEINARTAFASSHLFRDPVVSVSYCDMWRRQAVARLVETIPGEGGGYGITEENRSKVAKLLDVNTL